MEKRCLWYLSGLCFIIGGAVCYAGQQMKSTAQSCVDTDDYSYSSTDTCIDGFLNCNECYAWPKPGCTSCGGCGGAEFCPECCKSYNGGGSYHDFYIESYWPVMITGMAFMGVAVILVIADRCRMKRNTKSDALMSGVNS